MTAALIVSFDCEGKWGMADRSIDEQGSITSKALHSAYTNILDVLKRFEAPASFAFVSALCLNRQQMKLEIEEHRRVLRYGSVSWLRSAAASAASGRFEGWSEPELINRVKDYPGHHLCSHGGFHVPYDEVLTPDAAIDADISLIKRVESFIGNEQSEFVYPRNCIGYRHKLAVAGFRGYRDLDPSERGSSSIARLRRLLNEFVSCDRNDFGEHRYRKMDGLTALTPGKFLNAAIGLRSVVPNSLTRRRIAVFLEYAVKNDCIVHFYSHPHNLIKDPSLTRTLSYLLERASFLRDRGLLRILTMKEELEENQVE